MAGEAVRLEHQLALAGYFYDLFGAETMGDFRSWLDRIEEGYDEEGHSHFFADLSARHRVKVPRDKLLQYDENIREYVERLNRHRPAAEQVSLKYFQYLAALFAEVFLDRYFRDGEGLLRELNEFVRRHNEKAHYERDKFEAFSEHDLRKLAYSMATGSGKTLVMHINYWQFLRYNTEPLDNIVLITPNEGMSAQHLEEFAKSGIPAVAFGETDTTLFSAHREDRVTVLDIYKLTEEKKGEGVTVDVEAFEGKNLIFVDEGHKGSQTDRQAKRGWRRMRGLIAEGGFTFEYSATFAQAIGASTRDNGELLQEYSKAIIIDYSYKYFYEDGYGKDYNILNLREEFADGLTDTWLLGNLLTFYQQRCYYDENKDRLGPYHIEAPLWVFVGARVAAGKQGRSDVLRVVEFLQRVLSDREWAVDTIGKILAGESGIEADGHDVFEGRFSYLQENESADADRVYEGVLARVFRTDGRSPLRLVELKNADGEIGLKVAGQERYFGVINIGDTSRFLKLVAKDDESLVGEEDSFTASLFGDIADPDSKTNVLIGAKKFIEGWNSWRVSSMGLLNVGRSEGPQILQLFGRGVRLRGYDRSLKRSSAIGDTTHPANLDLVETLSVFGLRADYMQTFREVLEREGVDYEELPLPIEVNEAFLKRGLLVPRVPEERDFAREEFFSLPSDGTRNGIAVTIDLTPKVEVLASAEATAGPGTASREARQIPDNLLNLLDWDGIWQQVLSYKRERGFFNVTVGKETLRRLVYDGHYRLYCPDDYLKLERFADIDRIKEIVLMILRGAVRRLYNRRRQQWEMGILQYEKLGRGDRCFADYVLKIDRQEENGQLLEQLQELLGQQEKLYKSEGGELPRIYFDRHLYQPLLTKDERIATSPDGLNEGERKFVRDLRSHVQAPGNSDVLKGKEVFVLRNLTRGRGIGFFEGNNFYPDFIIWITAGKKQHILFVDPKGIRNLGNFTDPKIQLYKDIKKIERTLSPSVKGAVTLDSFVVSVSHYEDIQSTFEQGTSTKEGFKKHHVLFQEDDGYVGEMFEAVLSK